MRRLFLLMALVLVMLLAAALACSVEIQRDASFDATLDASASKIAQTSEAMTASPRVPLLIVPQSLEESTELGPNLVHNPGFEGGTVMHNGGPVAEDWDNFYCDVPYTPERCLAPMQSHHPGLYMGLAEWKISRVANRVHSGLQSQQWFGAARVVDGGVLQTVDTHPGQMCVFSAWVQTWSANQDNGRVFWNGYSNRWEFSADIYSSDIATEDDRANSVFMLGVAPGTNVYAFGSGVSWTSFGYDAGHYDHFARVEMPFTAQSDQTTIFIRNTRLWPLGHNDSYVDDVEVHCSGQETPTPAPSVTLSPTVTQTPVPSATSQPTVGSCPTQPACEPVIVIVTATPGVTETTTPTRTPSPTATATAPPTATPTITPTPGPTAANPTPTQVTEPMPTPAATPLGGETWPQTSNSDIVKIVTSSGLRIRNYPNADPRVYPVGTITGTWALGAKVRILCQVEWTDGGDIWGSPDPCYTDPGRWSAIAVGGTTYMEDVPGPVDDGGALTISRFAKVGDSISAAHEFLYPCGEGRFSAGLYPELTGTVTRYQTSFIRESNLAISGWTTRDVQIALTGHDTEYERWQPDVAFIMIGTNDPPDWLASGFSKTNLRTIVRGTLGRNIKPVLMTIPANKNKPVTEFNRMIYEVAGEFNVEVLDYFTLLSTLPSQGLSEDGVHPSIPPDGQTCYFNGTHMLYGMTARNWLIVSWLHEHSS